MNAIRLRGRGKALVLALAALALVAAMAWRVGAWNASTGSGSVGRVVAAGNARSGLDQEPGLDLYPPGTRLPAPKLAGPTLGGEPFALFDLAGHLVVINVWGSWCAPCRAEMPGLVRLAKEEASRGVRFVGINTRDNPDAAKAFVRSFHVPYPSLADRDGEVLLGFRGVVPTSVVPTTVVIDRQGRVSARVIGPVTYITLKGLLDDELAAGGGR